MPKTPTIPALRLTLWTSAVLMLCASPLCALQQADEPTDPLTRLSLQVWALQAMHDFDLDPVQLQALHAAGPETQAHGLQRTAPKAPPKYLAALQAMREALLHPAADVDEDRVDELRDDLEDMREDDGIEVDDRVVITDAARAKTADIVHLLRPSQLAAYMAVYQDEVPDPVPMLLDAATAARSAAEAKLDVSADKTARDVGFLVAGLDAEKAKAVEDKARVWLEHCRGLSDAEFKTQKPDLEKSAHDIVGDLDPFLVLRHWVERDIAELLSNPQLTAVVEAKLKQTNTRSAP